MWNFLKSMKGRKIDAGNLAQEGRNGKLWHGIDKYPWEVELSKRQKKAGDLLRDAVVAHGATQEAAAKIVDAMGDNGDVILNWRHSEQHANTRPIKVYEQDRTTHLLRVAFGAQARLDLMQLGFND